MAETNGTNGRDEVTASGLGFSGSIKGKELIGTVLLVLALVGVGVLYAQHDSSDNKLDVIIQQMRLANELSYLQTYTLSRPQHERTPMMPPAQLWKYLDRDTLKERESEKRQ